MTPGEGERSDRPSDARVVDSWRRNAGAWTDAVRRGEIESRHLVTDAAIVEAVRDRNPRSALDVGCGEGWLVRALAAAGIRATGVDAIAELVEAARRAGGDFRVASYEEIASGALDLTVDVVVANFSLIGHDAVEALIRKVPELLAADGRLIIQTLHPVIACGDAPYREGWRSGSWAGFSDRFTDPAPWYFRTIEGWVRLLTDAGFRLRELREPLHPHTLAPASAIFIAETA